MSFYASQFDCVIHEMIDNYQSEVIPEEPENTNPSWICSDCGEIIYDEDDLGVTTQSGGRICESCQEDNYYSCDDCGDIVHSDEIRVTHDERVICDSCFENEYSVCESCSEIFLSRDMESDDHNSYCISCYQENYFTCYDCDSITHIDYMCHCDNDDNDYCENCYPGDNDDNDDDTENSFHWLHSYGYSPTLRFYGNDNLDKSTLMYGIELEFDNGSPSQMDDLGSSVNYGWCTHDGSLSDKGIEWKTHPVTYQWIKENDPFTPVINAFKKCGYKSHDTKTCGLHIHMARTAFYDDQPRRSFNDVKKITSFVFLFEKFWHDVVLFSRRKHDFTNYDPSKNPIDRWASRYCDITDSGITYNLVKGKKDQKQGNRYQCVNLTNSDTIEVRIFKGTMKINTIMASIQLCQIFYELTNIPEDLLEVMTWNDVKVYARDHNYPEFISYCTERGI